VPIQSEVVAETVRPRRLRSSRLASGMMGKRRTPTIFRVSREQVSTVCNRDCCSGSLAGPRGRSGPVAIHAVDDLPYLHEGQVESEGLHVGDVARGEAERCLFQGVVLGLDRSAWGTLPPQYRWTMVMRRAGQVPRSLARSALIRPTSASSLKLVIEP